MISAQALTKYYGDKCAIRDLSFEIADGEIVGILGLNGAGKSTTLRILSSLLLPSGGTVRVNGVDVVENPHDVRKLVGFLPEHPPLYGEMTVESFLLFAAQLRGLNRDDARRRLEETLEATNSTEVRKEIIGNLSHGFYQRVGIAQAIIHDPAVLILDEPIQGLDPVQIVEMRALVRGLRGRHTILLSSHILSEISQTCDRILMIQEGKIVAAGTEQELDAQFTRGHRVHVVVRGAEAAVKRLIEGIREVTSCTVVDSKNRRDAADVVAVDVTSHDEAREMISRALVENGFGLIEIRQAETELESVFLRLSREQEGN